MFCTSSPFPRPLPNTLLPLFVISSSRFLRLLSFHFLLSSFLSPPLLPHPVNLPPSFLSATTSCTNISLYLIFFSFPSAFPFRVFGTFPLFHISHFSFLPLPFLSLCFISLFFFTYSLFSFPSTLSLLFLLSHPSVSLPFLLFSFTHLLIVLLAIFISYSPSYLPYFLHPSSHLPPRCVLIFFYFFLPLLTHFHLHFLSHSSPFPQLPLLMLCYFLFYIFTLCLPFPLCPLSFTPVSSSLPPLLLHEICMSLLFLQHLVHFLLTFHLCVSFLSCFLS